MTNLAAILGVEVNTSVSGKEIIGMKRKAHTNPYFLFKFVTTPNADGKSVTYYFVKAVQTGDMEVPVINLNRNDFVGVSLEFEIADAGNFFIQKEVVV